MRRIHGTNVFSRVEELLDPSHTVLLVIDMQNDFCTDGGHFHRAGKDLSGIQAMMPALSDLVDFARSTGVRTIHLQQTTLPAGASDSPAWLYLKTRGEADPDYTLEGTWGHDFAPGFAPFDGEQVIKKHRSSGFVNTVLPSVLAGLGAATVVCTGVATQGCVESTARDAVFFDFHAAVVADCVASTRRDLHDASLLVQSVRHEVLTSGDVTAIWRAASVADTRAASKEQHHA